MSRLLIVGGGLFGSLAAAYGRSRGVEVVVFDAGLPGAASHAAAGLFKLEWAGRKLRGHFDIALPVLDRLFGMRSVMLRHDDESIETFHCVPPTAILEREPIRAHVSAVGDGWLVADGQRYTGWVYVAAGVWSGAFDKGLQVEGRAGSALLFEGEMQGRIRPLGWGRQAIAFVREAGLTYFSDGTAEADYTEEHEKQTLANARALGIEAAPAQRLWGRRPYTPGGPIFQQLARRTWLATGGRKMGTILGAAFAHRLIEQELLA